MRYHRQGRVSGDQEKPTRRFTRHCRVLALNNPLVVSPYCSTALQQSRLHDWFILEPLSCMSFDANRQGEQSFNKRLFFIIAKRQKNSLSSQDKWKKKVRTKFASATWTITIEIAKGLPGIDFCKREKNINNRLFGLFLTSHLTLVQWFFYCSIMSQRNDCNETRLLVSSEE